MEKQPDLEFQRMLENIRRHFGFLFQRGFRIVSAMFTDHRNENWGTLLVRGDCMVKIHRQDGKIQLALNTTRLYDEIGLFDLHDLVYLIGEDASAYTSMDTASDETQQFQTTAQVLENYIDEILLILKNVHMDRSFSKTGELSVDNSPVFLFYGMDNKPYRRGPRVHAASA